MTDKSLEKRLLDEIHDYSEKSGYAVSTVCVRATGNSRLISILEKRAEKTARDAERVRSFISENPVQDEKKDAATP